MGTGHVYNLKKLQSLYLLWILKLPKHVSPPSTPGLPTSPTSPLQRSIYALTGHKMSKWSISLSDRLTDRHKEWDTFTLLQTRRYTSIQIDSPKGVFQKFWRDSIIYKAGIAGFFQLRSLQPLPLEPEKFSVEWKYRSFLALGFGV